MNYLDSRLFQKRGDFSITSFCLIHTLLVVTIFSAVIVLKFAFGEPSASWLAAVPAIVAVINTPLVAVGLSYGNSRRETRLEYTNNTINTQT